MLKMLRRYTEWLHTRWPAGKTEKAPVVQEGGDVAVPGVKVVGDLTGVPLLKFSADTGAKAIRAFLAEDNFEPGSGEADLDVAIIGAGVSGISAAIEASKHDLRYSVFESQESFSTIRNFPRRKPIYAYPTEMEPAGEMRFESEIKEDLLDELDEQRQRFGIEPVSAQVDRIEPTAKGLQLHFDSKSGLEPVVGW